MSEHYTIKIGTVKDRHELPVDYYVFHGPMDPNDMFRFETMQGLAIAEVLKIFHKEFEKHGEGKKCIIELYVTGLTIATIHVLNAIKATNQGAEPEELQIVAMHYNRETGEYHRQMVLL